MLRREPRRERRPDETEITQDAAIVDPLVIAPVPLCGKMVLPRRGICSCDRLGQVGMGNIGVELLGVAIGLCVGWLNGV